MPSRVCFTIRHGLRDATKITTKVVKKIYKTTFCKCKERLLSNEGDICTISPHAC